MKKTKVKAKPSTRAKAKPMKKPSTALATRSQLAKLETKVANLAIEDPAGMLGPAGFELGELANTGGVGLGEVKLTRAELKVITREVKRLDVRVLPDSGLAYLPHLYYTRWLNEAFGPTGWGIAPASRPMKVENLIIVPHILYIHKVAVAWANGAAEYFEKNKRQTYDDVLEATTAYALRRTCKRIGMALELWDKRWLAEFQAKDCVQVQTTKGPMWRRRDDPPFDNERAHGSKPAPANKVREGEVIDLVSPDSKDQAKISNEEVKRLVGIWRAAGRKDAEVRLWLTKTYGYTATKDIKRFDYQRIERALTARGDLQMPGDDND
jgi:hypothetical protein